jgi:hypothetical protein
MIDATVDGTAPSTVASIISATNTAGADNRLKITRPANGVYLRAKLTDGANVLQVPPEHGLGFIVRTLLPDLANAPQVRFGFGDANLATDDFGYVSAMEYRGSNSASLHQLLFTHKRDGINNPTTRSLHGDLGLGWGVLNIAESAGETYSSDEPWDLKAVLLSTGVADEWVVQYFMRSKFLGNDGHWFPINQDGPFTWTGNLEFRFHFRGLTAVAAGSFIELTTLKAGTGMSIDGEDYGVDMHSDPYVYAVGPREAADGSSGDDGEINCELQVLPNGRMVMQAMRGIAEGVADIDVDIYKLDLDDTIWQRITEGGNAIYQHVGNVGYHDTQLGRNVHTLVSVCTKWNHSTGERYLVTRTSTDGGETWSAEVSLLSLAPTEAFSSCRPGGWHKSGHWLFFVHSQTDPFNLWAMVSANPVPTALEDWTLVDTGIAGGVEASWHELMASDTLEMLCRHQGEQLYVGRLLGTLVDGAFVPDGSGLVRQDGQAGRPLMLDGADPSHVLPDQVGGLFLRCHTDSSRNREIYDISVRVGNDGDWQFLRRGAEVRGGVSYPILAADGRDVLMPFSVGRQHYVIRRFPNLLSTAAAEVIQPIPEAKRRMIIIHPDRIELLAPAGVDRWAHLINEDELPTSGYYNLPFTADTQLSGPGGASGHYSITAADFADPDWPVEDSAPGGRVAGTYFGSVNPGSYTSADTSQPIEAIPQFYFDGTRFWEVGRFEGKDDAANKLARTGDIPTPINVTVEVSD